MTSTPDDRAPEPTEGSGTESVPEPPAPEGQASAPGPQVPPPGENPAPPTAPDSASWGTPASPVYGGGTPAPAAGDTQPISTGLNDTQPLAWGAPVPPALVPGVAAPFAAPTGTSTSTSPYGAPVAAGPPVPPAPSGHDPYAAPVPVYGTPPAPGAGQPPYGGQPGYGSQPPYGAQPGYGSQPSYGAPAYGPPGQPHGYPPAAPTDGLAVASLVTSVGGLVLLAGAPGPIGVGLGIGALARIRRTGARGRGMAIAGIVVGVVGTIVITAVVLLLLAIAQWGATTAEQANDALGGQDLDQLMDELEGLEGLEGGGSSGGSSSEDLDQLLGELEKQLEGLGEEQLDVLPSYALPQDVAAGTCWESVPEYYDLSDAVAVPCTQEHEAEVVAVLTATGAPATDLTADDPVVSAAYGECETAVGAIDPGLLAWGVLDVWLPHPDQVAAGQAVGYCVYEDVSGSDASLVAPSGMSS
ncbi:MAG: DUF4190 domain-containing protein [Cellulomonas sp.]|uniref:DUF4190 domain-containing protein n=1 Tax=Cellulomonas sp. TaxID=40001 RepID=UPI001A0D7905|nr:DUF4190 domain-containing protein [Cellulomonas sp.]MBF0689352.1 DUF4190 domain-containing protein [Cellulomonas sp.]